MERSLCQYIHASQTILLPLSVIHHPKHPLLNTLPPHPTLAQVNKAEYDEGYEALMRVVKKTRKLAALSGTGELSGTGGPSVVDGKKPLLSSTSMALLSKAQDRPRGGGLAAGRAMAATPGAPAHPYPPSGGSSNNATGGFAAYALREKQVRMQMQTAATIVTAPPVGDYGDSDGDGENWHPQDRPRTTGGLRPSLKNAAGARPASSVATPLSGTGSVERARFSSPPRMPDGEAMAHVGGAVAGAGFSSPVPLRKDKLVELTRHSADTTNPDVDIMATRVEGVDGKLYHAPPPNE